ncbi:MAG: hypothetical protein FJZ63_02220 [Chlamydiae bacterium]|nr:hypothetical protein [Chlamydiota bacterium]
MSDLLEDIPAFTAASFLDMVVEVPCHEGLPKEPYRKPYLLPDTSMLMEEEATALVAISCGLQGIYLALLVEKPFEEAVFPEVYEGDAWEVFIDTRDRKTAGVLHKFCHHFVFLPKEVEGVQACEMTRLRAEDAHPLCDPKFLQVEAMFKKKAYELRVFIDKEALHGYDPGQFQRLGFTYRLHRKGDSPQHFNLGSQEYGIEKHPSLWASLKLTKE